MGFDYAAIVDRTPAVCAGKYYITSPNINVANGAYIGSQNQILNYFPCNAESCKCSLATFSDVTRN